MKLALANIIRHKTKVGPRHKVITEEQNVVGVSQILAFVFLRVTYITCP